MFKESIRCVSKKVSRVFQWSFKWGSRVFKRSSMGVLGKFQRCFNDVLFCKFVVAWISSQLPEQKEGLFDYLIILNYSFKKW